MDGLRQREVAASKAAAECQEMLSEMQEFAAHQQAQIQQLTQQMEVSALSSSTPPPCPSLLSLFDAALLKAAELDLWSSCCAAEKEVSVLP